MPRKKRSKQGPENQVSTGAGEFLAGNGARTSLFARTNRGLLLDIVVFILNIFLMRLLSRQFIDLFNQVSAENPLAELTLGLTFAALWILPAAGTGLQSSDFYPRSRTVTAHSLESGPGGWLFQP